MNIKNILKGFFASFLLLVFITGCDSYNEAVLTDIGNTREFSPVGVTAKVRNQLEVEINWEVSEKIDHYVVEFSANDPEFKTIFKTLEVNATELPVKVKLEGETVYSIRVKGISATGLDDSNWFVTTATTLSEQLFLPVQPGDILGKQITLRWVPNSSVTKLVLTPAEATKPTVTHTITAEEITSGVAVITGLSSMSKYTIDLFNNTSRRGNQEITTAVDLSDGIEVNPSDNLNDVVANAPAGALLILKPGDYRTFTNSEIILTKKVAIIGLYDFNMPKLHVKFTVNPGSFDASLINLDLEASTLTNPSVLTFSNTEGSFGNILLKGCTIHDFTRSLIAGGNNSKNIVNSVTIDNCIVTNVNTNAGADFIDFRLTYVKDIIVKNSTFNACSVSRDFIRADAGSTFSAVGNKTNVVLQNCTLNNVSNSAVVSPTAGKRILYLRFDSNSSTVSNNLITNTMALYSNQPTTVAPIYNKNYYFNAPGFKDSAIVNNLVDAAGVVADPQYVNAVSGDFTVKNQTLIDNNIGDPRWIK